MGKSLRNISVGGTWIVCFVVRDIMIAVPKKDTASIKTQVMFLINTPAQQNHKVESIIYLLSRESVSVRFSWCLIKR